LKIFKTKTNIVIFFLIFLLPFLFFIPMNSVKAATSTPIDVHTAYAMINNNTQYPDLLILDVREQSEYDESHLYNATLIPLGQIDSRISELMPRTGARGETASQNLAGNHNFTKIFNMDGAITAWIAAGYPVERGSNANPTIDFSLGIYLMILFGTIGLLLIYLKKRSYKK